MSTLFQRIVPVGSVMLLAIASALPAYAQGDCPTSVSGRSYYVSPGGGGSCTSQSPCSLRDGLSRAGGGDEVVLKDGTYRGGMSTRRGGSQSGPLTIRAENQHRAVIQQSSRSVNIDIRHSHIILRGVKADGAGNSRDNIRIFGGGSRIQNIIVENNWATSSAHASLYIGNASNVIVRHNLMERSGLNSQGEAIYLSSANSNYPVTNTEIYGNIFRSFTNNAVDYKGQAYSVNVHHNIFENRRNNWEGFPGDGVVRSEGRNSSTGNYFQNNIVRNMNRAHYTVRLTSNRVDVTNNIFANIPHRVFIYGPTTSSAIIRDNTVCHGPTSLGTNHSNHRPNNLSAPMSQCSAEIRRIESEMGALPRCGEVPVWPDTPLAEERPAPEKTDWTTILGPVAVGGAAATIIPNILPDSPKIGLTEFLGAMDSG